MIRMALRNKKRKRQKITEERE